MGFMVKMRKQFAGISVSSGRLMGVEQQQHGGEVVAEIQGQCCGNAWRMYCVMDSVDNSRHRDRRHYTRAFCPACDIR
ncbi:hypothetical protein J6590_063064 [Homalodisca vitripennis]|nr:hypothetical protein J6590_063064 [Homalodisca vitripennis]